MPAVRAAAPIAIDGALDEAAWRDAPVAKDFVQREPREGQPASEATEVRILYDDEALYIGVFAHDTRPSAIIVNELKKDFNTATSDGFQVVLDTFHDERNGYQFAVNPLGAKWDAQMVNEGREVNQNWDGIWHVQTRIVEQGWLAEIAIPFRTLKFADGSPQTWGVNFQRRLRRRNEDSYWAPLPRSENLSRVSLAGTLEGLQGVTPGHDFRIKPYALSSGSVVGQEGLDGDSDFGFDMKYAVTSGLVWDFTVNTDFSQVEADEQQINLTRFNLFFPEKRDFFLENSGVFQFGPSTERGGGAGGGGAGGGGRQNTIQDPILFFSRQIGLSDDAREIPIVAGTRLTGRSGPYTIGLLNIQQRGVDAVPAGPLTPARAAVPSTNVTAIRLRRNILTNSDVGVIVLNKEPSGTRFNRVFGADANFRFYRNFTVNAYAATSVSPPSVVAGEGDNWTTKTATGWRNNSWELRANYLMVGSRFNDELGFIARRGVNKTELFAGRRFRPKAISSWIRDIYPHWQFIDVRRQNGGGLDSRYIDWHLPFNFENSSFVEIGINPNIEDIPQAFVINRRKNISVLPGRYSFNEYFVTANSNAAAPLSFTGRYATGPFYNGTRDSYSGGVTARPNERMTLSASWAYNDIVVPQGAFTTTLVTGRINYSFSTRTFLNALLQYNTDARQWSSNVRFNIIHRPLSDFFLVYNERRDSTSRELIDRAVVGKLTWLLAF